MNYKLIAFGDRRPKIGKNVFLADGAVVAADVTIKDGANIWYNAVIRGDVAPVIIGENTNIQDGAVIHTSRFDKGRTHVGKNVTVGHMALLHACTVEDYGFVGMQAMILDGAVVEEYGFLGAGSLLSPGKVVRKKELWVGRPARFARHVSDEELEMMKGNIENYLELAATPKSPE